MKLTDRFCALLDEKKCRYTRADEGEKEIVSLGLAGDNFAGLHFHVMVDNDVSAQVKCVNVCKFPEEKNLLILQMCNQLNYKYRWTTWSVSPSGMVGAQIDMEATEETATELLFRYLCRLNNIIDEAYPTLMKAIYA